MPWFCCRTRAQTHRKLVGCSPSLPMFVECSLHIQEALSGAVFLSQVTQDKHRLKMGPRLGFCVLSPLLKISLLLQFELISTFKDSKVPDPALDSETAGAHTCFLQHPLPVKLVYPPQRACVGADHLFNELVIFSVGLFPFRAGAASYPQNRWSELLSILPPLLCLTFSLITHLPITCLTGPGVLLSTAVWRRMPA